MVVPRVTYFLLTTIVWPLLQAALTINVTPSTYTVGLTKSLKVECLLSRDTTSTLTFLMSLSLSHSPKTAHAEYVDLVSMNSFDSEIFGNVDNGAEAKVYGAINNKNTSYLSVIWEYPNPSKAGEYRCDANGLSSKGKPLTLSSTAEVTAVSPDNDRIVGELRRLSETMESQCIASDIKITQMDAKINRLTDLVDKHQLKFTKFDDMTLSVLRSAIFIPSPQFNGRRYWLTKEHLYINATTAEYFCKYFGGYLAEIDSAEEYNFIAANFLNKKLFTFAYVSGTDEEQEGVWRHHHSKNLMRYLNWGNAEPSGGRTENCLGYDGRNALVDINCSLFQTVSVGYICEIQE